MNDQNESRKGGDQSMVGGATDIQRVAPKTILVVDDELFQLRKAHVQNVVSDFYDTIADVTDDIFKNLWEVAKAVPGLGAGGWDQDAAAAYLASDAAVTTVLLSPQFKGIAQEPLQKLLAPFIARAARVEKLKQMFYAAFPTPEFDLQFAEPPRPQLSRVLQCAAVFLDLFLEQGAASPVDAVQAYLRQLAVEADAAVLPPLVLMSSHPELKQHKLRFSERAGISAAGLMVLPKATLMEPEFSARGLNLAFRQLERQKLVAHAMRLFIDSWIRALDEAKAKTARTLWNLDASAMQQIHLASVSDDDPYDEHLNELLSREHLFHVEADGNVASRVRELDKRFREQLTADEKVEHRLIAPLTDIDTARDFMSHFTWLGSPLPASFLIGEGEAASRISRSLPFGSVLCRGPLAHGDKCLIHITQQCDLNAISRSGNASRALTFATADALELQPSDNPIVKTTELVAKGLRLMQGGTRREFDLRVNVGDLFALPLCEFLARATSDGWHVIGRLRSDITNHIVAATTNQMSRPASQKMIRPGVLRSKVFLQAAVFERGMMGLVDRSSTEKRKPGKIFSLSRDDEKYSFQDEASIEIALWLAHYSADAGLTLDPDALSAELRRGWLSPAELAGGLKVRVRECEDLNEAYKGVLRGDIGGGGVQLTVVIEK